MSELLYQVTNLALWGLAVLGGYALRALRSRAKWRRVSEIAQRELDSPNGTNDPETAVATAVVTVNREPIAAASRKLKPSNPPPITE